MAKQRAYSGQSIQFKLSAKQAAYINDIIDEGHMDNQPTTVARRLFQAGIDWQIVQGLIDRRRGRLAPEDEK